MRYIFFINPAAGKGKGQAPIRATIEEHFRKHGGEYKIYNTRFSGDARERARKYAETGEQLTMFACGGEGTVFEVLNGVVGYSNVSLGVIPCGSANDFLKQFDTTRPFLDIAAQVDGERVPVDIIRAGDSYCLNGCSVGMDAVVASNMSRFKHLPLVSGKAAYTLAIVKTFLGKLGVRIKLSLDGKEGKWKSCLFAVIANAPYYGGGYKAAPEAIPNDGRLNFTLVDKISKLKILRFLNVYKNGRHQGLDCCTLKECESMEFSADCEIPVNLDGEIIKARSMSFEIVKKGIEFIVPKGVKLKMLTNV